MNEIRFKDSWNNERDQKSENIGNKDVKNNQKGINRLGIFFFTLCLLALVFWLLSFFDLNLSNLFGQKISQQNIYSAVFLSNGQVYFGKITEISSTEVVLKAVYYLQANESGGATSTSNNQFNLFKLGQELHGPEDVMYINKEHIMFYENLRSDSQLVRAISEYKQ